MNHLLYNRPRQPAAFAHRNREEEQRSTALIVQAIASLQKRSVGISLLHLVDEARRGDPSGRGVSQSTIIRNSDCYAAYVAARPPWVKRLRRKLPAALAKMTKAELAVALLAARARARESEKIIHQHALDMADLRAASSAGASAQ